MPLRDHFRPPLESRHSWEGFFGGWPAMIVQSLATLLPPHYAAEPRVHLGTPAASNTNPSEPAGYAVHVVDRQRGRRLVAAVEIVSPANKDRPDHRGAFVARCAALLQQGVS